MGMLLGTEARSEELGHCGRDSEECILVYISTLPFSFLDAMGFPLLYCSAMHFPLWSQVSWTEPNKPLFLLVLDVGYCVTVKREVPETELDHRN